MSYYLKLNIGIIDRDLYLNKDKKTGELRLFDDHDETLDWQTKFDEIDGIDEKGFRRVKA